MDNKEKKFPTSVSKVGRGFRSSGENQGGESFCSDRPLFLQEIVQYCSNLNLTHSMIFTVVNKNVLLSCLLCYQVPSSLSLNLLLMQFFFGAFSIKAIVDLSVICR